MQILAKPLFNALVSLGALDLQSAQSAELNFLKETKPIEQYILEVLHVPKTVFLEAISIAQQIQTVNLDTTIIESQALGLIPMQLAERFSIIPLEVKESEGILTIASTDPFNLNVIDFIEKKTKLKVVMKYAFSEDIKDHLRTVYSQSLSPEVKDALKDVEQMRKTQTNVETTSIKEAPVAKIVNTMLELAVQNRASDIHVEPQDNKTRVRYRIDGILYEKITLPRAIHDPVVSRIKILADLKIDEKRAPQDGRFNFKIADQDIDLRVSTLPTVLGEKIVMRLLKKSGGLPNLMELGMRGSQLASIEEAITRPNGIVLVTGPTGSGKTTTLYSILSKLNSPKTNISTLEDPVEYQIEGINQVQINPSAGLTFGSGLRAFLRQDPNIILVGEIRDSETTQLAIQAALTGHLVFSTLHTNDAATAIPRLIDMGAEPFLIVSVLNTSMAQRIVRRICEVCKHSYPAPVEQIDQIKQILGPLIKKEYEENPVFYKGDGCEACGGTGYKGRVGIYEVLTMTPTINNMVLKQANAKEIQTQAIKEGMITLMQDGFLKVLDGFTTVEEILRVAKDI